jgi:chemotaxis protein methyltransferase CheR
MNHARVRRQDRGGADMTDRECVEFLQWALPRLGLRWPGFRKVRGQVHKRIARRMSELSLTRLSEYRDYLETHSNEWELLDGLSRISISRFYRDRDVFNRLRDEILPDLARTARCRGEQTDAALGIFNLSVDLVSGKVDEL